MAELVEKDNAVKFHIYGEGSVKDKIAKMIEDKNLERNVFLKDIQQLHKNAWKILN